MHDDRTGKADRSHQAEKVVEIHDAAPQGASLAVLLAVFGVGDREDQRLRW